MNWLIVIVTPYPICEAVRCGVSRNSLYEVVSEVPPPVFYRAFKACYNLNNAVKTAIKSIAVSVIKVIEVCHKYTGFGFGYPAPVVVIV